MKFVTISRFFVLSAHMVTPIRHNSCHIDIFCHLKCLFVGVSRSHGKISTSCSSINLQIIKIPPATEITPCSSQLLRVGSPDPIRRFQISTPDLPGRSAIIKTLKKWPHVRWQAGWNFFFLPPLLTFDFGITVGETANAERIWFDQRLRENFSIFTCRSGFAALTFAGPVDQLRERGERSWQNIITRCRGSRATRKRRIWQHGPS